MPPINISAAQNQAKALLETRVNTLVTEKQTTAILNKIGEQHLPSTLKKWNDTQADIDNSGDGIPLIYHTPAEFTLRHYINRFACYYLGDAFENEELRATANTQFAEDYDTYLSKIEASETIRKLGVKYPIKKLNALCSTIIALAESGARPSPQTLQDGLNLLKAIQKTECTKSKESSPSAAILEEGFYFDLTETIKQSILYKNTFPNFITQEQKDWITKRLNEFREASPPNNRAKGDVSPAIFEYIKKTAQDNIRMTGEDYRKEVEKHIESLQLAETHEKITTALIQKTQEIMNILDITTSIAQR